MHTVYIYITHNDILLFQTISLGNLWMNFEYMILLDYKYYFYV